MAEDAGVTKGMLSAYETGRQRPSVDTLEKILSTLGCDLNDLHNAIQIINGRPEMIKQRGEGIVVDLPTCRPESTFGRSEVQRVLGLRDPLPFEEERGFMEMLDGFHHLLRYLYDRMAREAPEEHRARTKKV